jgi:two-component system chemotaxis response regulator CheY
MITPLDYDDVNVLIIDDDSITRDLLCRILQKMGIATVLCAVDGSEGLRMAHETVLSLVVCDVQMRPVDGLAFLGGLRNSMDKVVATTPVLMFTSDATTSAMDRAKKLGIDGYVIKPFSPSGFSIRVAELIATHHENRVGMRQFSVARTGAD